MTTEQDTLPRLRKKIEGLREKIGKGADSIYEDCIGLSSDLVDALLLDGCRAVRIGDNLYVVYGDTVLDAYTSDDDAIVDLLDDHGFTSCAPTAIYLCLWWAATDTLANMAMPLESLLMQAGLDPEDWMSRCSAWDEEQAAVENLYETYGLEFVTMQTEDQTVEEG